MVGGGHDVGDALGRTPRLVHTAVRVEVDVSHVFNPAETWDVVKLGAVRVDDVNKPSVRLVQVHVIVGVLEVGVRGVESLNGRIWTYSCIL